MLLSYIHIWCCGWCFPLNIFKTARLFRTKLQIPHLLPEASESLVPGWRQKKGNLAVLDNISRSPGKYRHKHFGWSCIRKRLAFWQHRLHTWNLQSMISWPLLCSIYVWIISFTFQLSNSIWGVEGRLNMTCKFWAYCLSLQVASEHLYGAEERYISGETEREIQINITEVLSLLSRSEVPTG